MPPNEGSPKNGLTHIHTSYSPLQQQNRNRRGEPPIIHRFKSEEKATSVFLSFLMSQIPEKTLYPKICPDVLKTARKTMAYSWSRSSVAPTLASYKPVSQTVTNCKLWEFRDAFFLPLDGFIDEGCCISGPGCKKFTTFLLTPWTPEWQFLSDSIQKPGEAPDKYKSSSTCNCTQTLGFPRPPNLTPSKCWKPQPYG